MAWQRAASVAEVVADKGLQVKVGDFDIVIFRLGDAIHALEAICPHAEAFLAEGFIDGENIECPLHQALFHIPTGKCLGPPADRDLDVFAVKVEGDDVLVDV